MQPIVIIGAGGDGLNITEVIEMLPESRIVGFLDDAPNKREESIHGYQVIGEIKDAVNYPDASFVLLVGSSKKLKTKKLVRERIPIDDYRFPPIINDKMTAISRYTDIGRGVVVLPLSTIKSNTVIGRFCFIASLVNVAHEVEIGDYCFLAPGAKIAGRSKLGEGVYIGMNACVREDIKIGDWSIIGMGAVVTKDVTPGSIMVGNPARRIGTNYV